MRPPIRIMLLDDHPIVRHGFATGLERESNIAVVGNFTTSRELMAALASQTADLLLIDYALGPNDIDGVNLIRALRVRYPDHPVLIASAHYNPATVSLALRAGASGFIGKTQPLEEVIQAINTVIANRHYIHPLMANELNLYGAPLQQTSSAEGTQMLIEHENLTPREREVLRCFLDGMSISKIAEKFSRNVNTISTQKQAALRKLGVRTDHELFKIRHLLGDM